MLDLNRGPWAPLKLISAWHPLSHWLASQNLLLASQKHVVTTISALNFTMLPLDRILTHIVNHISNTSYHLQYLYCQGGYVLGAKPNLITSVADISLSVDWRKKCRCRHSSIYIWLLKHQIVILAPEAAVCGRVDVQGSSLSTTCSLDLKGFFIPCHLHKVF